MPNDISVIALDGDAEGPNISPITVPSRRMDGGWGHMSGWGQICGKMSDPIYIPHSVIGNP